MARKRPTVVLVIGILNIIFGALGFLCIGVGAITMVAASQFAKAVPGSDPLELLERMNREIPGYSAILAVNLGCQLLLALVLLVSGIGLLYMKPWARWAGIFFSVAMILLSLASLVFTLSVANPTLKRVQAQMETQRVRQQGEPGAFAAPAPGPRPEQQVQEMASTVGTIVGTVISVGYALILLLILSGRSVSAAFAQQPPRRRRLETEDEVEEEDEDDG
jgi:hypothetical protein